MAAVISGQDAAALPQPRKLRVGIFADAAMQPRWLAEAFAGLAASEFAEVVSVKVGEGTPKASPLAWRLYSALDRRVFGRDPSEAVDLREAVPAKRFPVPDIKLDVAFALGDMDDAALDGVARYGVWRFNFRDSEREAGLREVAKGETLAACGLKVRLAAGEPWRLAYQSWSRTYPLSVARHRDQLLRKASAFVFRALREVHRSGRGWLEQCRVLPVQKNESIRSADILRIGKRLLQRGMEKARWIDQWSLALRFGPPGVSANLDGFTRLIPPADRDWADPFVLEKGGRHYVFFEELPYAAGRAHISMIEVKGDGSHSAPVKVLERDYHLSYPFLFEDDGELYMVPETARNGTVELWRCVDFPGRWKLERNLLEGVRCVDATLLRAHGRWWMFANVAAGGSRMFDDELHIFHATELAGEWRPHARNPVRSDVRGARPAGALYWRNGALYRPAQVCVPRYGAGLAVNRVLRITPQEYAERQVERIIPPPESGVLGLHTVNRAGYLTAIDVFERRRRR